MREDYYTKWTGKYGMGHTRRDRILELADVTQKRILDVGCATGVLGKILRDCGNWVGGVELSEEGIRQSRERLDQVWSFDIENEWPSELQKHDLDIIVLGEILEHVFDPVAVLEKAYAALSGDGCIIVTTPNFMTWTNRLRFLTGNFKYQQEGMFDFGHIRWFTYSYLKEVLIASKFRIMEEKHIIFPNKLSLLLRHLPSLFAWQFIIKAKKI